MLVLTRRPGEKIMLGDDIVVQVVQVVGNKVRIGIQAPRSLSIHRDDIRNAEATRTGPCVDKMRTCGLCQAMHARPLSPSAYV